MKSTILTIASSLALLTNVASAQDLYSDGGYTYGTASSGDYVNTYTDADGFTTGRIGDSYVNTYTADSYTSGKVGDDSVNLFNDGHGNTSGYVGDSYVNCDTLSGLTTCY